MINTATTSIAIQYYYRMRIHNLLTSRERRLLRRYVRFLCQCRKRSLLSFLVTDCILLLLNCIFVYFMPIFSRLFYSLISVWWRTVH